MDNFGVDHSRNKFFQHVGYQKGLHSTQKTNDMNYSQLTSDPSTCGKKRAQRSEYSILLRHMDDVGGARDQTNISWVILNTWRPVCIWQTWWCCAMMATQSIFWVLRSPRHAKVLVWRTVQTSCNPFWICTGYKTRNRQPILTDVRQWWSSRQQLLWMVQSTILPKKVTNRTFLFSN